MQRYAFVFQIPVTFVSQTPPVAFIAKSIHIFYNLNLSWEDHEFGPPFLLPIIFPGSNGSLRAPSGHPGFGDHFQSSHSLRAF
jgi:hypothetical protein